MQSLLFGPTVRVCGDAAGPYPGVRMWRWGGTSHGSASRSPAIGAFHVIVGINSVGGVSCADKVQNAKNPMAPLWTLCLNRSPACTRSVRTRRWMHGAPGTGVIISIGHDARRFTASPMCQRPKRCLRFAAHAAPYERDSRFHLVSLHILCTLSQAAISHRGRKRAHLVHRSR